MTLRSYAAPYVDVCDVLLILYCGNNPSQEDLHAYSFLGHHLSYDDVLWLTQLFCGFYALLHLNESMILFGLIPQIFVTMLLSCHHICQRLS